MTTIASSSIAQQAFAELALRPISSYGDDTPEALEAAEALPRARDMVLGSYDWSFARRLLTLPALTADAAAPYGADPHLPFVFAVPAQMRTLRGVFAADDHRRPVAWRRDGAILRAAETPIAALVTAAIDREDLLPASVQYAMALQLAALLSPRHAPTRAKADDIGARLRQAIAQARTDDTVSASHHRTDGLDDWEGDDWVARVLL